MAGMSVGGLSSGIDTASIVDQLIQVEAIGQNNLKTRKAQVQTAASAYRTINSRFDSLATAANNLTGANGWLKTSATSTATSVSVSAVTGTPTGALTFSVNNIATTHSVSAGQTFAGLDSDAGFGGSLTIRNSDGSERGVVTVGGTGTLSDVAAAINDGDFGVTAATVQVAPGQYRLQITSKTSGEDAAFSVDAAVGFNVSTQGKDARLTVGEGAGAYEVRSPTNTFDGLMAGVTVKVTKAETDVTIGVATDPQKMADGIKALVDAANAALDQISSYTFSTSTSKGTLAGDFNLARLSGQVLDAVAAAIGSEGSAAGYGIELTKDGRVTFNESKFIDSYNSDPAKAERLFIGTPATDTAAAVPGIAARLQAVAKSASDKVDGSLTMLAQGRDNSADDIQKQIEAWDIRLELRRANLTKMYTTMETMLSSLSNQSQWLSSQLSGLSRPS